MSHEYGHEFQFKMLRQNNRQPSNGPDLELQADVLGGYWVGARLKEQGGQNILMPGESEGIRATAKRAAYDFGDYAFNSPQHHGTPAQRQRAVEFGLSAGQQYKFGALSEAYATHGQELFDWSEARVAEIRGGGGGGVGTGSGGETPRPDDKVAPSADEDATESIEVTANPDYDSDTHRLNFTITYKNNSDRRVSVSTTVKAINGDALYKKPGAGRVLKTQIYTFTIAPNGSHDVQGEWAVTSDPGFGDPDLIYGGSDEAKAHGLLRAKFK